MSPFLVGVIGVLVFFVLIGVRMPIGLAMGIVGLAGYSYLVSPEAALRVVSNDFFGSFSSYSLSVIPMFIWMGSLAYHSGIGSKLFRFSYKAVGHLPGGLAAASQVAGAIFGAICGSSTAATATVGAMAIPEMRKYNYHPSVYTGSVAAAGGLGILIPPSIVFVVYGVATEQSIGKLLISGVLPGIILTVLNMIAVFITAARNPGLAPRGPRSPMSEVVRSVVYDLWEILLVFVVVLGGIFGGWFTPTEAGAIGTAALLAVGLAERSLKWKGFIQSILETTRTTTMILFLLGGATIFGRFLAVSRIPFELAGWTGGLPLPPWVIMGVIVAIYFVLGCFMDALAMITLTIPIFYPVVVGNLGYDPIWFGVIIVLVGIMGVITPPVGMNVYVVKGLVKDVPLEVIFRGVWPFVIAILVECAILTAFPGIATVLPQMMR